MTEDQTKKILSKFNRELSKGVSPDEAVFRSIPKTLTKTQTKKVAKYFMSLNEIRTGERKPMVVIDSLVPEAIALSAEILRDDKANLTLRHNVAKDILDRAGHAPPKVPNKDNVVVVNFTKVELSKDRQELAKEIGYSINENEDNEK